MIRSPSLIVLSKLDLATLMPFGEYVDAVRDAFRLHAEGGSVSPPAMHLPMIWDADFMLGPPDADGIDRYVLGEINVSSVFPIPDGAPSEIEAPRRGSA